MPAGQGSQNFFAGGIHSPFAQGRLVRVAESEGIGELDGVPDADTFHDRDVAPEGETLEETLDVALCEYVTELVPQLLKVEDGI